MGRRKTINTASLVMFDAETNKSTCKQCGKCLTGNLSGNIKRHYRLVHNYVEDANEGTESTNEAPLAKRNKRSQIRIEMDKNEFLKCCVGLVTVKSIPFRIFDDDQYFKKLIKPYEEHFRTNLNAKNIVDHVSTVSSEIKKIISKSVQNKMISLKIDVATRMEKSILGINIQYISNFKVNINTIGMIELKKRHTAEFLKEEILKCLCEFNISIRQVYSTTTDNGANVLKASKLLRDLQEGQFCFRANECALTDSPENSLDEFEEIHNQLEKVSILAVIRCAAHTIQLAAHDVLKKIETEVENCRKTVKNLRVRIRGGENFKMPVIDNATRWNSTFEMINSLFELKEEIENNDHLSDCPDVDWRFVQNFLKAFKPLADCTKKFQTVHYILGDFYRDWLCCEIELEEIKNTNEYARLLVESMIKRRDNLMTNNKALVAALYLDPRFNFANSPFLTDEQKQEAIKHLLHTNRAIRELCGELDSESTNSTPESQSSAVNTSTPSTSTAAGLYAKLERKMLSTIGINNSIEQRTLKQKLENLGYRDRLPFEQDVLDYWKDFSCNDREIGKLSQVVLAVPSSQVSVERAFSALSVILTRNRSKLSKDTLNKVLLVKLNGNILKELILTDAEE